MMSNSFYSCVGSGDKDGKHDQIGSVRATFLELQEAAQRGTGLKLTNAVTDQRAGTLYLQQSMTRTCIHPSFSLL